MGNTHRLGELFLEVIDSVSLQTAPVTAAKGFEQRLFFVVVEYGPWLTEWGGPYRRTAEKRQLIRPVPGKNRTQNLSRQQLMPRRQGRPKSLS